MTSRKPHGKTFVLATAGIAVLAWAGIMFLPTERVDAKVEKPQHSSGTVACGGYYTTDNQQTLRWVFRNHNDTAITITGFRVYDWDGNLVWDSADSTKGGYLPKDRNRIIGQTLGNTLPAFASAWYRSEDLTAIDPNIGLSVLPQHPAVPTGFQRFRNHVMVHVDWVAAVPDTPVNALSGSTVRHVYSQPGKVEPWGRSTSTCQNY